MNSDFDAQEIWKLTKEILEQWGAIEVWNPVTVAKVYDDKYIYIVSILRQDGTKLFHSDIRIYIKMPDKKLQKYLEGGENPTELQRFGLPTKSAKSTLIKKHTFVYQSLISEDGICDNFYFRAGQWTWYIQRLSDFSKKLQQAIHILESEEVDDRNFFEVDWSTNLM
jgi:hypothetical protein